MSVYELVLKREPGDLSAIEPQKIDSPGLIKLLGSRNQ